MNGVPVVSALLLCVAVGQPTLPSPARDDTGHALATGIDAASKLPVGVAPLGDLPPAAVAGVCGPDPVIWNNNLGPNGVNGRALSPPEFPAIRVLDDFDFLGSLSLSGFHVAVIEDGGWVPGATMETTIRREGAGGGPSPGAGGVFAARTSAYTRIATGRSYFGRDEYDYCQAFSPPIVLEQPDRYWIGPRIPGGGGTGTNYFLTSDGGPDGSRSSTGYFSLNGGTTFVPAGPGWHFAFELNGVETFPPGACCDDGSGDCEDGVRREDCTGRFSGGMLCEDIDPPCGRFNDECEEATVLECGDVASFHNLALTHEQDDPPVCDPSGKGQLLAHTAWFRIAPTAARLVVRTCDSTDGDTVIALFTDDGGDCRALTEYEACDFASCAPHAEFCAAVTTEQEYLLLVGSTPGSGSAHVTLEVQCLEECPPPPSGACCTDHGRTCEDLSETECETREGLWIAERRCADDPCPGPGLCGPAPLAWDNNVVSNGVSGRGLSPPSFPNVRVVDDFTTSGDLILRSLHVAAVEDGGWAPGAQLETFVRFNNPSGGPVGGSQGLVATVIGPHTRTATGTSYFGRAEYLYCQELDPPVDLTAGRYWVGIRHPFPLGTGTNYWLTSNGGPDGGGGTTGYASIDAGATFTSEGPGWHHAFELTGTVGTATGACCQRDGTCTPDATRSECLALEGEWRGEGVTCAETGCQEHTGACCREGACAEETRTSCTGACTRQPQWICEGDVDGNGVVNPVDVGLVQAAFCTPGQCPDPDLCQYDIDCNGAISPVDSGLVQAQFGVCDPPSPPCGGGGPPGEFLGYDSTCTDNPCALGACCDGTLCVGTTREAACDTRWHEGEDCDQGFECPNICPWDNNPMTNGVNGRPLSPPSFPASRIVDDIDLTSGCIVQRLVVNVIEDAPWTPGPSVTVTVRRTQGGGPAPGGGGILEEELVTTWTRAATGASYFGRANYRYEISGVGITIPSDGRYWIGLRNEQAGGSGTNYWMTSDGGGNGAGSSTGYFSLDGGSTFFPEGAGWHHAFAINP
jgi:hypothetical protein